VVRHPRGGAQVSTTTRQSATRDARCVVRGAWCVVRGRLELAVPPRTLV
jgi:hypothetical protein